MDAIGQFVKAKKEDSEYIGLEDGETVAVRKLIDAKVITKTGFDGKEKEVLRLVCEVETSKGIKNKSFDNGTARFAAELQTKKIEVGDSFKITRHGLMAKTRYEITDVVKPQATPTPPEDPFKSKAAAPAA